MDKIRSFWSKNKLILLIILLISVIKIFVLREFNNKEFEPDGYNHVLYANSIFEDFPKFFSLGLDVWAKPLYTYGYGILDHLIGAKTLFVYQSFNLIVWDLISFLVYFIIKKSSLTYAIIVSILCNLSFLAFRDSVSALTEPLFALTIILNIFFLQRKNYIWATVFISLSPLGRIEGFLFVTIYIAFLLYETIKKNIKLKKFILLIVLSILPAVIWDLLGYIKSGDILFVIARGYPTQAGIYGYGSWLHFFRGFYNQDIFLAIFFALGLVFLIIRIKKNLIPNYIVISIVYTTLFFVINIYLWKHGEFGTAGLMRYFVSIIPLMVIIGGKGFATIEALNIEKKKMLKYFVIGIVFILQLLYSLHIMYSKTFYDMQNTYPQPYPVWLTSGYWIKKENPTCYIYAQEPAILYYGDRDFSNSTIYFVNIEKNPQMDKLYLVSSTWVNENEQQINMPNIKLIKDFGEVKVYLDSGSIKSDNCNLDIK